MPNTKNDGFGVTISIKSGKNLTKCLIIFFLILILVWLAKDLNK